MREMRDDEPPQLAQRWADLPVVGLDEAEDAARGTRAIEPNVLREPRPACVHGVDFLLTWNCTHIANTRIFRRLRPFVVRTATNRPSSARPRN